MNNVHELTPQHPKALAALEAKLAVRRERDYRKVFVAVRVAEQGYKFIDFGPEFLSRPMTLCFRVQRKDVLWVSTALAHPNDRYSKADGRLYAAQAMDRGAHITLRKPADASAYTYLRQVFGNANVIPVELMI